MDLLLRQLGQPDRLPAGGKRPGKLHRLGHGRVFCGGAGAAGAGEAAKTEFDVVLASFGDAKMAVIKVAKEVLGLGLKEAKEVVESAPKAIKEGVSEAEANELKEKFEAAGATIEIK